jgi:hypothetical protein
MLLIQYGRKTTDAIPMRRRSDVSSQNTRGSGESDER